MIKNTRTSVHRRLIGRALAASLVASLCAVFIVPSAVIHAQSETNAGQRVKFGVLLGTNISTLSDFDKALAASIDGTLEKKKRVGLNIGAYATIPLSGIVSLQPEVHYVQNGVSIQASNSDGSGKLALKSDYVEVPLLLRLESDGGTSGVHPFIVGGASAAYRVSCSLKLTANNTSVSQSCKPNNSTGADPATDPIKKENFSLVGGAGLAFLNHGHSVSLQARYSHGLTNIATNETEPGIQPKFRVLSILLGIGM